MKKLMIGLTLLTSITAFADQCNYITKAEAKRALVVALEAKIIQSFCEPCQYAEAKTLSVKSIGIKNMNYEGSWALQINGKNADLAYTFVNGLNLSKIVGCKSQNVSSSIRKD